MSRILKSTRKYKTWNSQHFNGRHDNYNVSAWFHLKNVSKPHQNLTSSYWRCCNLCIVGYILWNLIKVDKDIFSLKFLTSQTNKIQKCLNNLMHELAFYFFFLPSFPLIKHHPINFRFEDISDHSHSFTNCEYYSTGTSRHGSYKKTVIDI